MNDSWRTPKDFFATLDAHHRFTLDVAADLFNSMCRNHCCDGLAEPWEGHTVWCNPPYSNIAPWVEKAIREPNAEIHMLLPVFTETDWFARLLDARATLLFLRPRLKFEGATSNAPFRLMLAHFNGVGGVRVYNWREDPLYRCATPSLFAEVSA